MTKKNTKRSKRPSRGTKNSRALVPSATTEYQARTSENLAALRYTKSLKGPNNKYINSLYNALSSVTYTSTAPFVFCLNAVAQGTNENGRIGRLTKNLWLDLDINIYMTPTNGDQSNGYRVYIVVETTALGSALAPAQFFVDAATFGPTSQRDRTNRNASRYVVLYDSGPFNLGTPAVASALAAPAVIGAGQPTEKFISRHIPLNFMTDYSRANGGTIADIDTNALSLLVVTDATGSGTSGIIGGFTLCFNDDS